MRKRQWDSDTQINITPLIDILFILLLFFILTSTFEIMQDQAIEISLPQAQTGQAMQTGTRWVVSVSPQNEITLEGQRVTLQELEARMKRDIEMNRVSDPSILADEKAHHGVVIQILDLFRRQGIHNVHIEVRMEEP